MKRGLVIIGVCLILLMTLSIVSAGWFTGYATKIQDGDEINLYNGDEREFEIGRVEFKITNVRVNSTEIGFTIGGRAYNLFPGEELTSDESLDIALLYIDEVWWRKAVFANPYRARLKLSRIEEEQGEEEQIPIPVGTEEDITLYGRYTVKTGDKIIFAKANHEINIETRNQCLDNPCNETVSVSVIKFHRIDNPARYYHEAGIGESIVLSGTSSVTSSKKSNVKVTVFDINPTKKEADIGLAYYDSLVSSEPVNYRRILDMLKSCTYDKVWLNEYPISCDEKCEKKGKIAVNSFVVGRYRMKEDNIPSESYSLYFANMFETNRKWSDIGSVIEELVEENLNGVSNSGDIALMCHCCSAS